MRNSNLNSLEEQFEYLFKFLKDCTDCPEDCLDDLKLKISRFTSKFKTKWIQARRIERYFLEIHESWLRGTLSFTDYSKKNAQSKGRPKLNFEDCSERSKRRKTQELREKHTEEELVFATQMSLRMSGKIKESNIVRSISKKDNDIQQNKNKSCLPPEEGLAMIIDAKLSRQQYEIIRSKDKEKFPSYKKIQETKTKCYPESENVVISSTEAEIQLQSLLDLTVFRLLEAQKEVFETYSFKSLTLISKWGFDGSSGQSEYKMKFDDDIDCDSSIFMVSLVPIQLVTNDLQGEEKILWKNPRTSSTRYCRPIKFIFAQESKDLVLKEKQLMDDQIMKLINTKCKFENEVFEITHKLLLTMVDGKICNFVTHNASTQRCYLCNLTSKDFNDLPLVLKSQVDAAKTEFGISILHGWIRLFECFLHLSYKLSLKTWQARGEESKKVVAEKKKNIQAEFKKKLGLIVDKPKPGFGNSNDGNTARRFFESYSVSAEITGIDEELIKRFGTIMQTLASGFNINHDKFSKFCLATAERYVNLYPWYPMPVTVHKILIHSTDIISNFLIPIGQLSEEAQEARNKEFKMCRRNFTRKCSRTKNNQDILNYLLVSSDPLISSFREKGPKRNLRYFSKDTLNMLEGPVCKNTQTENFSSSDDTESD